MRPKYQLRLESPRDKADVLIAAVMPSLRELFGPEATFDFRVFKSRYDPGHVLTYIDVNKREGDSDADRS